MDREELLEILKNVPRGTKIELNTIVNEKGELELSPISEAHYDKERNKVCITPMQISI